MTITAELDSLNARFALGDQLRFQAHADGVVVATIRNHHATAQVALQGAQVLSYQPNGVEPVLWLSNAARCLPGKAIRGGIPLCWPWFGTHPEDPSKPAHGYARTAPWKVRGSSATAAATILELELPLRQEYQTLTPHAAALTVTVVISVGSQLRAALTTRNTGMTSIRLSQALHTYFNISDINSVRVLGLEGCEYIDKVDGGLRKRQQGAVHIGSEVDRIYLDTAADCVIDDSGLHRRIHIKHEGSRSTVVWNPWIEKGARLGDLGADGYCHMLCVETTNAADDARQLAPGDEHTLATVISCENFLLQRNSP